MSKPKLLVLHGKVNFNMPTFAESTPVRKAFDVTKARTITGRPDVVYCQSYVQCLGQLKRWDGPCVVPLGGIMEFKSGKAKRYGRVLTQNKNRTLAFMSEWLMNDFLRRDLDCGAGACLTYLPHGHWGMDHAISGVKVNRFRKKDNYSLGNPPTVIMSLTLSASVVFGRWQKCRGIPIFLNAVKDVAEKYNVRFICAGLMEKGFPYLDEWREKYNFTFVKSHHKVDKIDAWPDRLAEADVFVHPSMYDGWARAPAEAMCAAIPAMMFSGPGIPHIGDTMIWCDPESPETVAQTLDKLLESESMRRDVSEMQHAEALKLTDRHRGDLAKILLGALE